MLDTVTGWFEVVRYDDKRAITITNLVETMWLFRYPRPIEITYYQGKEFIDHDFRKPLIETEYRITAKPSTLGNPMSNAILELIHQFPGKLVQNFNIQQTYINKMTHEQANRLKQSLKLSKQPIGQKIIVRAN